MDDVGLKCALSPIFARYSSTTPAPEPMMISTYLAFLPATAQYVMSRFSCFISCGFNLASTVPDLQQDTSHVLEQGVASSAQLLDPCKSLASATGAKSDRMPQPF